MVIRPARFLATVLLTFMCACAPAEPASETEAPADETNVDLGSPVDETTTLRVGNYNIQWFGDVDAGPSDEALQLERAAVVMASADVDLWVLSEIVDQDHFDDLVARLPGFEGFLASDPAVAGGSSHYGEGEQKLAIVYRASAVHVASPRIVLASYSYAFASRPPIALDVTVDPGGADLAFTLIGVHMKAMGDAESYQRRKQGSLALHGLLDGELAGRSVLVIGDWNDDIDKSIAGGPTPYADIASDSDYRFLTRELSLANIGSRTTGTSFLDHQLAGGPILGMFVEGSTERVDARELFADYGSTTSDHFPIVSTFVLPGSAGAIINEVLANEPGSDTAAEFVEVVAPGCKPVDLSAYTLRFDGVEVFRFPAGTVLQPGEAAVVFSRASAVPPGLAHAFAAGGLGLLNKGGEVTLERAGSIRSSAAWSSSSDGVSITRAVEGDGSSTFVAHPLRKGKARSPGTTVDGATSFGSCAGAAD